MLLLVVLGSGIGAIIRDLSTKALNKYNYNYLTLLIINTSGCALLGLLTALTYSSSYYMFWGIGLCGGLTTYSTFNSKVIKIIKSYSIKFGIIYLLISYIIGFVCFLIGYIGGLKLK